MDWRERFADRVAVVTGAGGVIGGWLTAGFRSAGMVVMATDHASDRLAPAAALGCAVHACDLTDAAAIDGLVATTVAAVGVPDLVVNNAGVYPSGFLLDIDAAEWDRVFDVNLRAPFLVARGFARAMIAAGRTGSILNVSSGAARKMRATVVPYCVSKTALDRLTKGLALELATHGIRVNALEPGFAPGSVASPLPDAHVQATLAQIPLARASTARDVVDAALFLASDLAGFVTGTSLAVDGGNSIGSLVVHQDKKTAL